MPVAREAEEAIPPSQKKHVYLQGKFPNAPRGGMRTILSHFTNQNLGLPLQKFCSGHDPGSMMD